MQPSLLEVERIDLIDFEEALALQLKSVIARERGSSPNRLILLEHPALLTKGRGSVENLDHLNIPTHEVARGGEVTWHGPGQTVGYWIRRLDGPERDLHRHLRLIEAGLIRALAALGLNTGRREGATGVWHGAKKLASIGVGVRSWVAYHGFALNRSVDAETWQGFKPCGFAPEVMSDLAREGCPVARRVLEDQLADSFSNLENDLAQGLDLRSEL